MSKVDTYHVIAKIDGGWSVKRAGAERAAKSFDTRREAIAFGRDISRHNSAELYIHDLNGRLENKVSYLTDSNAPRKKRGRAVIGNGMAASSGRSRY